MQKEVKQHFEALITEYSPRLYAQIRSMVLNHDDANDVLQNTWLKAWRGFEEYRGEAAVSSWLFRIAYNEAVQHFRKQKVRKIFIWRTVQQATPPITTDSADAREKLFEALKGLSPQQRAVFAMRYFNDMPVKETAEALGLAEGTIKAAYHQAVKKIETYIKNDPY